MTALPGGHTHALRPAAALEEGRGQAQATEDIPPVEYAMDTGPCGGCALHRCITGTIFWFCEVLHVVTKSYFLLVTEVSAGVALKAAALAALGVVMPSATVSQSSASLL